MFMVLQDYLTIAPRSRPKLVLLTQTYLVEVLADCVSSHWDSIDQPSSPVPSANLRNPGLSSRKTRRREREPPPLDDAQANYVLELLLRLTASPLSDGTDGYSTIGDSKNEKDTKDSKGRDNKGGNNSQTQNRDRDRDRDRDTEALDGLPRKPTDLERASFKTIEYLSATNWGLVYHTFGTKLKHLRTTAADDSDASSLTFIAHLWLNQKKLSILLQEIGGSFLPLRKAPQNTIAALLPETIHRWIDAHPKDFVDLHVDNRRLEGGGEILFDLASGLVDGTRRRSVIWPLQTALILLLPDVFWVLEMRGEQRGGSFAKKVAFLNNLRQSLRLSKSSDMAASCLITICRAGSLFPAESESALLSFALDVQNEVTDEIFKRQQWVSGMVSGNSVNGNGSSFGETEGVDRDVMIKAFVSSARLSVESVVEGLLPRCLEKNAPVAFKITAFAGVAVLATQVCKSLVVFLSTAGEPFAESVGLSDFS